MHEAQELFIWEESAEQHVDGDCERFTGGQIGRRVANIYSNTRHYLITRNVVTS